MLKYPCLVLDHDDTVVQSEATVNYPFFIEFLKEYTCAEKSVAIGNYENDISMIKAADVGVAVGNCFDECIKAADIVTVPCEEHSVADLIYNYL